MDFLFKSSILQWDRKCKYFYAKRICKEIIAHCTINICGKRKYLFFFSSKHVVYSRYYVRHFRTQWNCNKYPMGVITTIGPIFQVKKLRLGKVKQLSQGHTTRRGCAKIPVQAIWLWSLSFHPLFNVMPD